MLLSPRIHDRPSGVSPPGSSLQRPPTGLGGGAHRESERGGVSDDLHAVAELRARAAGGDEEVPAGWRQGAGEADARVV